MEAEKLNPNEASNQKRGKTTREKVDNTLTEELFFGICAPVGSLKEDVIKSIERVLVNTYDYDVEIKKLSTYIDDYKVNEYKQIEKKTEAYSKLRHKITEGNEIRRKYNNNSVLVELAIQDIHVDRLKENNENNKVDSNTKIKITDLKSRRVCYIFDSIKNKEELLLLRRIYTKNFFQFSVFSPESERRENLKGKDLAPTEIDDIINKDEFENNDYGQNVRGTFSQGDFFLRVSKENIEGFEQKIDNKIQRFLHLIFESDIITPTVEETAMYSAKSAAGNSACLSRQVGASIIDVNGNLISTGWNDVPKYGGNLYREGDIIDDRCKNKGHCSNDTHKDLLVNNLVDSLVEDKKVSNIFNDENGFLDIKIVELVKRNLRQSKVKDLIEFSRSVHAEMHAIISGSQLSGSKMINGKLFCTTYPCHNCARHIIVAGIKEVYYIEPYVKSLCLTLHDDAITEDENCNEKVRILIFDGVAPRNYLTFFTNFADRKENGKIIDIEFENIKPKISKSLQALPTLEQQAIHSLRECGLID